MSRSILIAEDEPVARRRLQATLTQWSYDVLAVGDGREALAALDQPNPPRLAILDWMMPDCDGLTVCREVRRRADRPYTYLIVLTAREQKEDMVAALDAGADDYLIKPFDVGELRARLGAGLRILDLQDELIAAREALRIQAMHDALTGVYNRVAVMDALDRELARCRRENASLGVIMADLDHFKQINDTFGHPAGDAALREAAQRIQAGTRPYDFLGRYGGEEFIIVLPHCGLAEAGIVAERVRAGIAAASVPFGGDNIGLSISLGVSATDEHSIYDTFTLIQIADAALYRAKRAGRNRVELGRTAIPLVTEPG